MERTELGRELLKRCYPPPSGIAWVYMEDMENAGSRNLQGGHVVRVKSGWVKLFHSAPFDCMTSDIWKGPPVQLFGPPVPLDPATWLSPAPCMLAGSRGLSSSLMQVGSWSVASGLLQVETISQAGVGVTQNNWPAATRDAELVPRLDTSP